MTEEVNGPRPLLVDLGDEVCYQGLKWRLDDEALIGLEGQPDIVFNKLDPKEVVAILDNLRPAPPAQ
jgi:hypothetical protein